MIKKSKVVSLAAFAACVMSAAAANADTITLNLVYLGSTTANLTGTKTNPATQLPNGSSIGLSNSAVQVSPFSAGGGDGVFNQTTAGLTTMDLTSPTVQATPNLKNYFGVYATYNPGANADALFGVGFNVVTTPGLVPVASNNVTGGTVAKWISWNPTDTFAGGATWSVNGVQGAPSQGTLSNIGFFQTSAGIAFDTLAGTPSADGTPSSGFDGIGYDSGRGGALLGVFALQFTGVPTATQSITLQYGGQGDFQYFTSPTATTAVANDAGFTGGTFDIPVSAVPEPASLGVLALGGIALMARRRKTA